MAYCQGPRRCGPSKPKWEGREKRPPAEVPMHRYIHEIPAPREALPLCRFEELLEEQNSLLRALLEQMKAMQECCGGAGEENG